MKRFLLALACLLVAGALPAAIAHFGVAHYPSTDDADPGASDTATVTPPASMLAGDFVLVVFAVRSNNACTFAITEASGQNWRQTARQSSDTNTAIGLWLVWAVYNPPWGLDPAFTCATTADAVIAKMQVYRGVDRSNPLDVLPASGFTAQPSTTVAASDFTTIVANALALVIGGSRDNQTWSIDNSLVAPSGNIYWRSAGGADSSLVLAQKAMVSPGAVGVTTMTQTSVPDDGGAWFTLALRPDTAARKGITVVH